MARRIPQCTVILSGAVAGNDDFVVFDTSADETKRISRTELAALFASDLSASTILSKLLSVDGPGSLLDADTLDGVQLAALAQLSGAAFTGNVSTTGTVTATGAGTFGKVVTPDLESRLTQETISSDTTLTSTHANHQIYTGNILTLNPNVFVKGDWVVLHATADARFNRGSGLTMYSDGTNTANVYVRPFRSAVAIFDSPTVARIIGGTTTPP